ncbi:hypothetical protein Scep_021691 [Stephania cephalantha]|uniref:Uncharacterized protein n=1 Tax=Stephania cephalantha TaxID=152367 RepID=A0AAP0I0F3_9MAGN
MRGDNQLVLAFLKSKYFPRSQFMEADLGPRPSWFWRGWFDGKDIVEEGLRWRVGDSTKVKIWDDFWIAKKEKSKLWSLRIEGLIWVKDLISHSTKNWNGDLIKSSFREEEAKFILATLLSREGCEDQLVWHYEKSGLFSVRSTYKLAVTLD